MNSPKGHKQIQQIMYAKTKSMPSRSCQKDSGDKSNESTTKNRAKVNEIDTTNTSYAKRRGTKNDQVKMAKTVG